jgi:antitoxin ParD1/3/4
MKRNTSVTLTPHYAQFVQGCLDQGRFASVSEAVRAGLFLLEEQQKKIEFLKGCFAEANRQWEAGETVDGEAFMDQLMNYPPLSAKV